MKYYWLIDTAECHSTNYRLRNELNAVHIRTQEESDSKFVRQFICELTESDLIAIKLASNDITIFEMTKNDIIYFTSRGYIKS